MNAAIYTRISKDREGRGLGVARQEADCRALCTARGWTVTAVYTDNDLSASTGKRRPAYQRLLDDVKNGAVGAIVAYHVDRLHRSPRELEDFIDIIEAAGAEVATVAGGAYDLSTATGRMAARIVGAVARAESERQRERIRRKHLELAQAGKDSGGGTRPFGFTDRTHVDPVEAELVRAAAKDVLAGRSLRGITVDWQDTVPTVTGKRWTTHVLRRLLTSARVAGKREHNGILTDAEWPAILDEPTWIRVRALLLDPGRTVNGNPRRYLLTGIAQCALCETKLVARPRADKARCYVCATGPGFHGCGKIRRLAEPVEALVADRLFDWLDTNTVAAHTADNGQLDTALQHVTQLEQQLAELAADYYTDKVISRPQFLAASQRLTQRLETAQQAVRTVTRRSTPVPDDLRGTWTELGFDVQRALVEQFVERVAVEPAVRGFNRFDPTKVHVAWRNIR